MEQEDNDRIQRETENGRDMSDNENLCSDLTDTEEDTSSEEDKAMVEKPPEQLQRSEQQTEMSEDENVAPLPHSSEDDDDDDDEEEEEEDDNDKHDNDDDGADSFISSSYNDDNNSNYAVFAGYDDGSNDPKGDSSASLSFGDDTHVETDQARSNEIHRLDNFSGLLDENEAETCSEQILEVEISELEENSEDEEEEYYISEDEDSETDSEEYEKYQEKLYCHPVYAQEIFQKLEEMKQCSLFTDLSLRTSSGFSLCAHSVVLAAVSTAVKQMLQDMDGAKESEMFLSLSPEMSDLGLSAVLEFAYTGTITGLNKASLALIQKAALILGVPRVLGLCREENERERKKDGDKGTEENLSAEKQLKLSLESVSQLWKERVGCDVELEAEGRIFRAHKVLLIASSDYFRAMFTSGMRESQQVSVSLLLMGAAELGLLLECSYSGALALDWGCVFELTCTALQFQFQPALSLCLNFMQQEMDADGCLDVAAFAEAYGMSDLQDMAEDFVLRHFEEVAATVKFQDLPVERLKTYLCSNSLYVTSELPLFRAVVSWIGANPRMRVREARELLANIQFPLMTFKEFKEVKDITSWPKVSNEELYDSLLEEFCSSNFNVFLDFRTYLPKEVLVLVGGERITESLDKCMPCKEIWFSNSFRNHVGQVKRVEWRELGDLPERPRFCHCVGAIQGKLYVVGGRHYYGKIDTMKCAYRYDPMQNSWQKLADMAERRCSFALVVLDEKIYAMGGDRDSDTNVESVEVYCPDTDSWSFARPLDQRLSSHAASVWNGKIFISGGLDCRYHCLVSMLLYNPETGTTYLEDMFQSRAQHCMETFQDRLYVAGGVSYVGGELVDQLACEFYDPVSDFWGTISPLSVPHVSAGSAVLEGKIYILGGYCLEDYSDTKRVHRYDPKMRYWENMCGTPGPTTYIAACVLPVPSNLRQL